MAGTYVDAEARTEAAPPAAAEAGSTAPAAAATGAVPSPQTAKKAYELINAQSHRAYVWWESDAPTVDADDPAFRRRVQRALQKPIWSREDEIDEFGMRSDRIVLIQPDDPRYRSRLLWRWDQLKIRGLVAVDVVTLPDRQSVRRFAPLLGNRA